MTQEKLKTSIELLGIVDHIKSNNFEELKNLVEIFSKSYNLTIVEILETVDEENDIPVAFLATEHENYEILKWFAESGYNIFQTQKRNDKYDSIYTLAKNKEKIFETIDIVAKIYIDQIFTQLDENFNKIVQDSKNTDEDTENVFLNAQQNFENFLNIYKEFLKRSSLSSAYWEKSANMLAQYIKPKFYDYKISHGIASPFMIIQDYKDKNPETFKIKNEDLVIPLKTEASRWMLGLGAVVAVPTISAITVNLLLKNFANGFKDNKLALAFPTALTVILSFTGTIFGAAVITVKEKYKHATRITEEIAQKYNNITKPSDRQKIKNAMLNKFTEKIFSNFDDNIEQTKNSISK